jgi:4-amino-4-deoxy-L-arabinose transferase-like glycosyltransferase
VRVPITSRRLPSVGFWGWMAAAVGLTLLLRAPWLGAPLGNDEGGLTYVAAHWHQGGPDLYGHYFIDRPPLLLGVFRIAAAAGGAIAVRAIGAIAAAALVLIVALLGRELGGTRSGIWAGAIAAVLGSSALLGSVFTPAELLAVLPSAASVLLLLIARRSVRREHLLLLLAGLLAAAALLVKQSFGDALVAGIAFLLVSAYLDRGNRRRWAGLAAAYAGGIALALGGLEIWEILGGVPDGATGYALIGFRLQGLSALSGSAGGLPARFADRLAMPLVGSGLALILIWSLAGIHQLRNERNLQLTIAAWGAAGVAGVLLGGSYWSHYLIELIPMAAATAALALSSRGRLLARVSALALITVAIGGALAGPDRSDARGSASTPEEIGIAIAARAHHGDTIYVRYSQPNITYYSGLRNPYPYDWSLMLRTIPGAQHRLRALLRSPARPTWVVAWESSTAYDLDGDGTTARLINRHYRPAGEVDGVPVLLERGLRRPAG